MEHLEIAANNGYTSTKPDLADPNNGGNISFKQSCNMYEDIDSACSTPYVSAPSSPGRSSTAGAVGFFYSAPTSPMHFILSDSTSNSISVISEDKLTTASSFEFEAKGPASVSSMSSADELFLNGQIRPTRLSSHLNRPQGLGLDKNGEENDERGRDLRRSLRRRSRSMSPLRSTFRWRESVVDEDEGKAKDCIDEVEEQVIEDLEEKKNSETTTSGSSSSSLRRNSKPWVFLKEFLYRSKSEGRNSSSHKWSSFSFSPIKDKKMSLSSCKEKSPSSSSSWSDGTRVEASQRVKQVGKKRVGMSAHELHYTANRAQAEEMRRKTFLPYRQGLFGCLGFTSKSYGAMDGFARAFTPVPSKVA